MTFEQKARPESMTSAARADLPPLSDHACFVFLSIRILPRKTLAEAELTLQDRLADAARVQSDTAGTRDPLPWLPASERLGALAGRRGAQPADDGQCHRVVFAGARAVGGVEVNAASSDRFPFTMSVPVIRVTAIWRKRALGY
jgi:hypothetical protein